MSLTQQRLSGYSLWAWEIGKLPYSQIFGELCFPSRWPHCSVLVEQSLVFVHALAMGSRMHEYLWSECYR